MIASRFHELQEEFRSKGHRLTEPRRLILKLLLETRGHPSAEEIYHLVHRSYPQTGLATVYRTLELLAGMGLLTKLHFGDGRHRYELTVRPSSPEHHHHLVCTECKGVIDYADFVSEELDLLQRVQKSLSRKHGFEISGHAIEFYGKCPACREK